MLKQKELDMAKAGLDKTISTNQILLVYLQCIEHCSNFADAKIQKLIEVQRINHTLNYIEFPGVDSELKRVAEKVIFYGDIHVPRVYYFTSYVFENLMNEARV